MNSFILGNLLSSFPNLTADFKACGTRIELPAGKFLIKSDTPSDFLYLLIQGNVEKSLIDASGAKKICCIHMGSCLIGTESMDGVDSSLFYRCLSPSVVYALRLALLSQLSPKALHELFLYTITETAQLQAHFRTITSLDSRSIIFQIFSEYESVIAEERPATIISLTQQVLSEMIGKSRQQVANIMKNADSLPNGGMTKAHV